MSNTQNNQAEIGPKQAINLLYHLLAPAQLDKLHTAHDRVDEFLEAQNWTWDRAYNHGLSIFRRCAEATPRADGVPPAVMVFKKEMENAGLSKADETANALYTLVRTQQAAGDMAEALRAERNVQQERGQVLISGMFEKKAELRKSADYFKQTLVEIGCNQEEANKVCATFTALIKQKLRQLGTPVRQ